MMVIIRIVIFIAIIIVNIAIYVLIIAATLLLIIGVYQNFVGFCRIGLAGEQHFRV